MNKAVRLSLFVLAVCMMGDTQTISYPARSALKKADHVLSLATTAACVTALFSKEQSLLEDLGLVCATASMTANTVVNGMALKYDKKGATLRLLLPMSIMGGFCGLWASKNKQLEKIAENAMIAGFLSNCVKNIWDVYSLVKHNQSESTQHDA